MATVIIGADYAPPKKFKVSAIKVKLNFKSQRVAIGSKAAELLTVNTERRVFFLLNGVNTYITSRLSNIEGKIGLPVTVGGANGFNVSLSAEAMAKMGFKPEKGKDYLHVELDTLPRTIDNVVDCYLMKL